MAGCKPDPISKDDSNENSETFSVPTFYGNNTKTILIDSNNPSKLAELCYSWYAPAITGFKTIDRNDLSSYRPMFLGEEMTITIEAETEASLTLKGVSDNFGFTLIMDKKTNTFSYFQSFVGSYIENPESRYLGIAFSDSMSITNDGIIKGDVQYQFYTNGAFGTGLGEYFSSPKCSGVAIYKVTNNMDDVEHLFANASLTVEDNSDAEAAYALMRDFYEGKEETFMDNRYLAYIDNGIFGDVGDMGPTVTTKEEIQTAINTLDSRWVLAH